MKEDQVIVDPSWWRLQADLAWGRTLLSIATMREGVEVHPEVYLFLGNRYWWLARRHFVRDRQARSQRLVRKARFYFRQGGGPEPSSWGGFDADSASALIHVGGRLGGRWRRRQCCLSIVPPARVPPAAFMTVLPSSFSGNSGPRPLLR